MNNELKPCPFCGTTDPGHEESSDYVTCPICRADGPMENKEGVTWNTRSPEPTHHDQEIEVLARELYIRNPDEHPVNAFVVAEHFINGRDQWRKDRNETDKSGEGS